MSMIGIQYLGQCGFLFSSEQISIAIDPVLTDLRDEKGETLRLYPAFFTPEELKADFILCTHDHIDHMAEETLRRVAGTNEKTLFVVPKGCVKEMISWGIAEARVIGISDGEEVSLFDGACTIKGVSAAHPVHQVDAEGMDHNLVYGIRMEEKQLVHLGDTYRTERLFEALKQLGAIHAFFAPINGRDEEREAKGIIGNLSETEAAELAASLEVELAIPTHFDMIIGNTGDPQKFMEALKKESYKGKCRIPCRDEKIVL